jgi:hypothetical protein
MHYEPRGRAQLNVCQLHLSFYAGSCAFEPSRTREMRITCMATSVSLAVATAWHAVELMEGADLMSTHHTNQKRVFHHTLHVG